jgi:hypothetical protein
MTPLMQQGFRRPITDKDIWKLDSWDETETLYSQYVFFSFSLLKCQILEPANLNVAILSQIPEMLE